MVQKKLVMLFLSLCCDCFSMSGEGLKETCDRQNSMTTCAESSNLEPEERQTSVIMGSMGLLGFHKPGVRAVFAKDAIYCSEVAVFFNGISRIYRPCHDYQLPFFAHFEKCAREHAVKSSDPAVVNFLRDDFTNFVLIEVEDTLEVILHYLSVLNRGKMTRDGGVYGDELTHNEVLHYFQLFAENCDYEIKLNDEEMLEEAVRCISKQYNSVEFPQGGSLVTSLEYSTVFCALRQYKWVKRVRNLFESSIK